MKQLFRLPILSLVFMSILSVQVFFTPSVAHAVPPAHCTKRILSLPVWYEYLDVGSDCEITGPTNGGEFDWPKAVGYVAIALVEIMLRIAGLVAVGFVIYGGFRFIVSQGEPENAKAARETIINAIIGLIITIVAAAVVNFVAKAIAG
jgi:hypothetical protein